MKRGSYLVLAVYIFLFVVVILGFIAWEKNAKITGFVTGESCIDPDAEIDTYITQTNVTHELTNYEDSCLDYYTLNEYYCNSTNDTLIEEYSCLIGCNKGKCNTNTICDDPDVGANNYTTKNTTTGRNITNPNQEITGEDFCQDSNTLIEFYCAGEQDDFLVNETHTCAEGFTCTGGICAEETCTPDWQELNYSCGTDETFTNYWNDTNNCGVSSNEEINTYYCDNNSNNIIGTFSDFSSSGTSLSVYVNNSVGNISQTFTGTQKVEFKDANSTRIEFDWDFSNPLNMHEIHIETQSVSATKGYILIKNLEVSKKILIDKLNASSNSVCVKDANVVSPSNVSLNCNASDETIVPCPGSSGNFVCSIINNQYQVTGISHSLIVEFIDPNISCTPSWNCTTWETCSNDIQTRVCTDSNSCGITAGKPGENQSCAFLTAEEGCTPTWSCTNWNPSECPEEKIQKRTCTDENQCDSQEGKPSESKTCTPGEGLNWLFIFLVFIIILSIAGVIFLLLKMKKKIKKSPINKPSSPPQPKPFPPRHLPLRKKPYGRPPARNNRFLK